MYVHKRFVIGKNWKQPQSPSIYQKINFVISIVYYSAIKTNELLIHTIWMNLKIIMLRNKREYILVLKHRFYYYYSIMTRPTNQMIATEKTVCYSQFPRGGSMPGHTGAT